MNAQQIDKWNKRQVNGKQDKKTAQIIKRRKKDIKKKHRMSNR